MNDINKLQGKDEKWPLDGLESVPNCPVCGSDTRFLLHKGLTDQIFFCAPGKWDIYRCESCTCAYLNPRPTLETISLAYQRYYTHNEVPSFRSLGYLRKIRRIFVNGYRNYRYGTRDYPASFLGVVVANLWLNGRLTIDAEMRHLPKINGKKSLLDIGCGNGAFLLRGRSAGWHVVGVDLDEKAVEVARSKGLDVRRGGVDILDTDSEKFDVITLSHVIEHVHDPITVLKTCYKLLKPDGYLWVETPNISSEGYRLFGSSWRGLEPPRHLVLFTMEAMRYALHTAGFKGIEVQPYRPVCKNIFRSSKAIFDGVNPYTASYKGMKPTLLKRAERAEKKDPLCREFITVKAFK